MDTEKLKRIRRVAFIATLFIVIGIIYVAVVSFLKFGIPCVFYELTGLKCPGCGITRAIISMLHFRIYDAMTYNALAFLIIAYILFIFINTSWVYIKSGIYHLSAGKEYISVIFLILLVAWGIVRNVIGM